ncbi:hypothetical protein KP79_PYT23239 [Mizuhopecten yessoensis]|uniref:Uncharacterized protein n=1 Tax=Mizuhopecten yessoensis TaxID=6573 RepID=A0A210PWA2_MIZYE|nr:hypothetical protein KP79_PYT23239 [Mizuhopecten yessoensis]
MNYVGSISILDRGHAPAQAIIDKNARSLAQRVADETREELEKVMNRVDNIYESYETSTQALMTQSTMEYVEDIAELEALIKDQLKKKKYQQQVTIFIVGYENVCGQKLRLLQQVNEFFMDNSKSYEEEDWYPKTPDIDVDDCSNKIEESLATAKELTEKISTINSDMVEWLTTYAINKASTKSKKKLESALTKAKDDVKAITDQLKSALLANDEKDELIQTYLKQLEGKTLEAQKFKAAAEVAKIKLEELQSVVEKHKLELHESRRELLALHQDQITALHETHKADLETVRLEYAETIKKLQEGWRNVQSNEIADWKHSESEILTLLDIIDVNCVSISTVALGVRTSGRRAMICAMMCDRVIVMYTAGRVYNSNYKHESMVNQFSVHGKETEERYIGNSDLFSNG